MNPEPDHPNEPRLHSCAWSEDGRTLIALFDLADGGVGVQSWTIGQRVTDLRDRSRALRPARAPRTSG